MRVCAILPAILLVPALLDAQTPVRWIVSWTDDSYRFVEGKPVPVGLQQYRLTMTPTRGDSVVAVLPTANPAIVDTLDGTATTSQIVLRSRARGALGRPDGSSQNVSGITVAMTLTIDLTGSDGTGTLTSQISGLPGMAFATPTVTPIVARRER